MAEKTKTPVRAPIITPETEPDTRRRYAPSQPCPNQRDETVRRIRSV